MKHYSTTKDQGSFNAKNKYLNENKNWTERDEDDIVDAGNLMQSYLEKTRQSTRSKVTEIHQARGQHGPQRGQFRDNRAQMHTNAAPRGQRRKTVSR